jgi:ATP-dependent Clp protease ATP-binding subunit ClpA
MAKKKSLEEQAKFNYLNQAKAVSRNCPTLNMAGRNLTAMYLEGKLDEVYNRDTYTANIQKILLRKSKANVLLTGPAGCGKTAIAERLAGVLAHRAIEQTAKEIKAEQNYDSAMKAYRRAQDKAWDDGEEFNMPFPEKEEVPKNILSNIVLFELSLTALVSGTRYRGDFEERVQKILDECKQYPNLILFIDEIHQIVKTGGSDGSEGMAQMLKPALARKDICVIGATTTEEAEFIWKDKALARRFNEVKVAPLHGKSANETAEKILNDYAKFHNIAISAECVNEILSKLSTFLPQTVFPDNFINVVDETLAGARFDGLTEVDMSHFNAVLSRMAGVVIL